MEEIHVPRPPSVTIPCLLIMGTAIWSIVAGLLEMNEQMYDQAGRSVGWQLFAGPIVAFPCAIYMFRGKRWARLTFWFGYGALALFLVIADPEPLQYVRLAVYAVGAVLVRFPSANWYFAGRNYRRAAAAVAASAPVKTRRTVTVAKEPHRTTRHSRDYRY